MANLTHFMCSNLTHLSPRPAPPDLSSRDPPPDLGPAGPLRMRWQWRSMPAPQWGWANPWGIWSQVCSDVSLQVFVACLSFKVGWDQIWHLNSIPFRRNVRSPGSQRIISSWIPWQNLWVSGGRCIDEGRLIRDQMGHLQLEAMNLETILEWHTLKMWHVTSSIVETAFDPCGGLRVPQGKQHLQHLELNGGMDVWVMDLSDWLKGPRHTDTSQFLAWNLSNGSWVGLLIRMTHTQQSEVEPSWTTASAEVATKGHIAIF